MGKSVRGRLTVFFKSMVFRSMWESIPRVRKISSLLYTRLAACRCWRASPENECAAARSASSLPVTASRRSPLLSHTPNYFFFSSIIRNLLESSAAFCMATGYARTGDEIHRRDAEGAEKTIAFLRPPRLCGEFLKSSLYDFNSQSTSRL